MWIYNMWTEEPQGVFTSEKTFHFFVNNFTFSNSYPLNIWFSDSVSFLNWWEDTSSKHWAPDFCMYLTAHRFLVAMRLLEHCIKTDMVSAYWYNCVQKMWRQLHKIYSLAINKQVICVILQKKTQFPLYACFYLVPAICLPYLELNQVQRKEHPSVIGQITSTKVENITNKL